MATTIKPLEDRVLVQPLEAEQTTASGLVIPDTAKEKPSEGKVVATSELRPDEKNASSHRALAFGQLITVVRQHNL